MNAKHFLGCIASLALAAPAIAGTLYVPQDQPTVAAALLAAAAGDTIQLADGRYAEHALQITTPLTLRGDPVSPSAVVLDAEHLGRILVADPAAGRVELEGLTLTGRSTAGSSGGQGCLEFTSTAFVALRHCDIADNDAEGRAALSVNAYDSLAVRDSRFLRNRGTAVLQLSGGTDASVRSGRYERCLFAQNEYALYASFASATVRHCTFVEQSGPQGKQPLQGVLSTEHADIDLFDAVVAFNSIPSFTVCTTSPGHYEFQAVCSLIFGNEEQNTPSGCSPVYPKFMTCDRCLELDPCFCDLASGDYGLSGDSPAAPGATDCTEGMGVYGVQCPPSGCTGVPASSTSWGALKRHC